MNITHTLKDGILKLILDGRLDTFGSGPAQQALDAYFDEHPKFVVMDMTKVEFVSSAGIRVFLIAAKETKARGGALLLVGLNPYCRELVKATHVGDILFQFDAMDQADAFCLEKR